jgi:hypothetical protein
MNIQIEFFHKYKHDNLSSNQEEKFNKASLTD